MLIHATRSDALSTMCILSLCCLLQPVGEVLYKSAASFLLGGVHDCDLIEHTLLKTDASIHINQNAL